MSTIKDILLGPGMAQVKERAMKTGLFENEREYQDFVIGALMSRRLSYRANGLTYEDTELHVDLDEAIDSLKEMQRDYQRERDQRQREIDAYASGDESVFGSKTENKGLWSKAAAWLRRVTRPY